MPAGHRPQLHMHAHEVTGPNIGHTIGDKSLCHLVTVVQGAEMLSNEEIVS